MKCASPSATLAPSSGGSICSSDASHDVIFGSDRAEGPNDSIVIDRLHAIVQRDRHGVVMACHRAEEICRLKAVTIAVIPEHVHSVRSRTGRNAFVLQTRH